MADAVLSVFVAINMIAGIPLAIAAFAAWIGRSHRRSAEREAERLQRLNAWQHWPAPQSPVELEQQALALRACSPARASALGVAGSRDAREWARRNPDLARELAQVLAGHE